MDQSVCYILDLFLKEPLNEVLEDVTEVLEEAIDVLEDVTEVVEACFSDV